MQNEMLNFNTNEINQLIKSRRSVYPKMYSSSPIDDHIIHQILENANWAPNHKHTEPWRFVVFSGNALPKLAEFQAKMYKSESLSSDSFDHDRYEKLLSKPLKSSHIIAIGMKRDLRESVPEVEEILAVGCAIQNMYLTATAYGIGCYLSTGGVTYTEEAKEFFGLEKKDRLIGFLHLGNLKSEPPVGRRGRVEDKVRWEF